MQVCQRFGGCSNPLVSELKEGWPGPQSGGRSPHKFSPPPGTMCWT